MEVEGKRCNSGIKGDKTCKHSETVLVFCVFEVKDDNGETGKVQYMASFDRLLSTSLFHIVHNSES